MSLQLLLVLVLAAHVGVVKSRVLDAVCNARCEICRGDRNFTYLIYKHLVALRGSYNCHYVKFSGRRRPLGQEGSSLALSEGKSQLPETRADS